MGVANPATVDKLMQLASCVANYAGYQVVVTHVVTVAPQISLTTARSSTEVSMAEALLRQAIEAGRRYGIVARAVVQVAREVHHGIISAAQSHEADVILLGYSELAADARQSAEKAFDRIVHKVARGSRVHVVVAKFRVDQMRTVLVPVGAGINLPLTGLLTKAIREHFEARVEFVHIVDADSQVSAARDEMARLLASYDLDGVGQVNIVVADNILDAILERAAEHDLAIVGAEPSGSLAEVIFGNLAERIAAQAPCSVLLVRSARG